MADSFKSSKSRSYLKKYANLITILQRDYPGFFPALQKAYLVENEKAKMPTADDMMWEIIRKYDLVPRRSLSTRTMGVQVRSPAPDAEIQTTCKSKYVRSQTSESIVEICDAKPQMSHVSTQTYQMDSSPSNSLHRVPESSDPLVALTYREDIVRSHERKSESAPIPSLLDLNVPKPENASTRTLEFLKETDRHGCWNCGEIDHRFSQCKLRLRQFCFGCGKPGYLSNNCTYCASKSSKLS